MPDFFHIQSPVFSPTECVFCQANLDPEGFLDGGRDMPGYGHVYLCAKCAVQAGARFGMHTQDEAKLLADEVIRAQAELDQLYAKLAEEQDKKLVSGRELRALLKEKAAK